MKFNTYLKYGIKELIKKPTVFVTSFLVCFAGMLITFNMLFMQYGAYMSDLRQAEEEYHICLPELLPEDISKIESISYVKSVSFQKDGDSYTAYIKLFDNDPYTLKHYCDRVIIDSGIINKPEYKNNSYYNMYGPQDNWINNAYYKLATDNFALKVGPLIMLFILLTALCLFVSIQLKVKNDISDYGAMRSYGYGIERIMRILRAQYSVIYHIASALALTVSVVIFKFTSELINSDYTSNFQRIDFSVPILETVITYILAYLAVMLFIAFCRKTVSGDICPMLRRTNKYKVTAVARSSDSFERKADISLYGRLYIRRSRKTVITQVLRKSLLLMLPFFFVFLAISIYGMREQANKWERDYGIHSLGKNFLTDDIIAEVSAVDLVERTVLRSYEDGRYSGIDIYCKDGTQEEADDALREISDKYSLYFTDDYHDDILVIKQSNTFTLFYMIQAVILFIAALLISIADTKYILLCRTYELSVIRSLGLSGQQLIKLYRPEIAVAVAAFVLGTSVSCIGWVLGFGIPYVRWLFIAVTVICFACLYIGSHYMICIKHMKRITEKSIIENIRAIDI